MSKKENEIKNYFMWYVPITDIKSSVEEALLYYKKKGFKILSIEVSKTNCEKSFTVEDIIVRPKKEILKNHIYLEFYLETEKENVETNS